MGGHLVKLVTARWSHISDRAFRVLTVMAVTALDTATDACEAGVYFGGQEPLMAVLRNERGGTRATRERTVKKAITELVEERAIVRVAQGRAGRKAIYRLSLEAAASANLPAASSYASINKEGDFQSPAVGDPGGPAEGDSQSPALGDPQRPPKETREETRKEPSQEPTGGTLPPDPLRPSAPTASGHWTDQSESLTDPLTPAQDQQRKSLPHAREAEPATDLRLVPGTPRPAPAPQPLIPAHTPAVVADAIRRRAAARHHHQHRSAS